MRVGLTGGVGSGKSTVAQLLAGHGAVVIDADAVSREVVAPGTPGLAEVAEAFGPAVLHPDGTLDRAALARVVFGDEEQLATLNAIVHPRVGQRVAALVAAADPDDVLVYDVPLLVETNPQADGFDLVVVVETAVDIRLERLADRGMGEQDARERIARQASDEQRRAIADVVIRNDCELTELRRQVDAAWERIVTASQQHGRGRSEP